MFHKIKAITAMPEFCLCVQFAEGVTKIYDVKPLFDKWKAFKALESSPELFRCVEVDIGGYGIIWNLNCKMKRNLTLSFYISFLFIATLFG